MNQQIYHPVPPSGLPFGIGSSAQYQQPVYTQQTAPAQQPGQSQLTPLSVSPTNNTYGYPTPAAAPAPGHRASFSSGVAPAQPNNLRPAPVESPPQSYSAVSLPGIATLLAADAKITEQFTPVGRLTPPSGRGSTDQGRKTSWPSASTQTDSRSSVGSVSYTNLPANSITPPLVSPGRTSVSSPVPIPTANGLTLQQPTVRKASTSTETWQGSGNSTPATEATPSWNQAAQHVAHHHVRQTQPIPVPTPAAPQPGMPGLQSSSVQQFQHIQPMAQMQQMGQVPRPVQGMPIQHGAPVAYAMGGAGALPPVQGVPVKMQQPMQQHMGRFIPGPQQFYPYTQMMPSAPGVQFSMNNAHSAPAEHYDGSGYTWMPDSSNVSIGSSSQNFNQEIKRRTKTGCLTCRRRRIKCDEQHPTCKNCRKSERICLGYDPVFTSQMAVQLRSLRSRRQKFRLEHPNNGRVVKKEPGAGRSMKILSLVEGSAGPEGVNGESGTDISVPSRVSSWEDLARIFRDSLAQRFDRMLGVSRFAGISHSVMLQLAQQSGQSSRACKVAGELEAMRQLVSIVFTSIEGLDDLNLSSCNLEKLVETDDYCLLRAVVECLTTREGANPPSSRVETSISRKLTALNAILYPTRSKLCSPVQAEVVDAALQSDTGAGLKTEAVWNLVSSLSTGEVLNSQQFEVLYKRVDDALLSGAGAEVVLLLGLEVAASALDRERARELLLRLDLSTDVLAQALLEIGLDH